MNDKQRNVVIGAIIAVIVALAYPPFHLHARPGIIINLGYSWLWEPPARGSLFGTVNVSLLVVEWLAIALVAGALWWLFKEKS